MKRRLLYAYPIRFAFMLAACLFAAVILQVQALSGALAWLRRPLHQHSPP